MAHSRSHQHGQHRVKNNSLSLVHFNAIYCHRRSWNLLIDVFALLLLVYDRKLSNLVKFLSLIVTDRVFTSVKVD